ncbi:GntR family transcriptional regulator [Agrobacterium sp. LAD9]|uniref:GntR family transcriptional regulator n=1 Tax=Agrobacterium sp. LAD9 TaxID=2055153 RepID=UPI0018655DCF|nr:GntR family transcriptional regulator [Agrobacterium sp. LAD9]
MIPQGNAMQKQAKVDDVWTISELVRPGPASGADTGAHSWKNGLEELAIVGGDFWSLAREIRQHVDEERTEDSTNHVERVYETLRLAVRAGTLGTGTPLIEAEIADALGVSRTPVREAIQRLSVDGLLSRRKRGWEVKKLDIFHIRESYEVRMSLEGFATAQAAIRATEQDRAAISTMVRERGALRFEDLSRRMKTNRDFHNRIFAASGNERLIDLIKKNTQYYFAQRFAQFVTKEEATLFQDQHEQIAGAIEARNPSVAETHARQHVKSTFLVFEKFYKIL